MVSLDVMLSSTSRDLPTHREKAKDACERAGFRVTWMENLTALIQGNDAITASTEDTSETDDVNEA